MGPITGLATITAVLTIVLAVATLLVVGLGLAVVVPALRESRRTRVQRHVSVPAWYLHTATSH